MAGTVITILEKTDFDFGTLAANANVADALYTQDIDISRYKEATLLIRVHTSALTNSATLNVKLKGVLPSPEDPAQYFRENSFVVSTTVASTDTAPRLLKVVVGTANLGAMLSLFIGASGGLNGGVAKATISVVLSLKD